MSVKSRNKHSTFAGTLQEKATAKLYALLSATNSNTLALTKKPQQLRAVVCADRSLQQDQKCILQQQILLD